MKKPWLVLKPLPSSNNNVGFPGGLYKAFVGPPENWSAPAVKDTDTVASLVACNSFTTETFRNVQMSGYSHELLRLFLLYNKNLIFCCVYICKSMNTGLQTYTMSRV